MRSASAAPNCAPQRCVPGRGGDACRWRSAVSVWARDQMMRKAGAVPVSIMWFRRDLRVVDHAALAAAAASGTVVPLFVVDPSMYGAVGAVRQAALVEAMRALGQSMGGRLVIRHGDPRAVVAAVAHEVGARDVFVTADHAPAGRRRDKAVHEALVESGARLVRVGSNYVVPPGTLLTGAGTPSAVFTPFRKRWEPHTFELPIEVGDVDWLGDPDIRCDGRPMVSPDGEGVDSSRWFVTGADASARLDHFIAGSLAGYKVDRNLPSLDGTSRLGTALHFGTMHPRTVLDEVRRAVAADPSMAEGAEVFVSEIGWREFYADVLYHRPETAWENLQAGMSGLAVDTDAAAKDRFARWTAGQTGYPIVDAGMRQLTTTGWMHNRVRMITASFLVKDLHLPWQWGARHFMAHLCDGDVASNNHGWQWTAGTGTDAAPFFRVFNPSLQGARFDPDGAYVRSFVPELAGVPDRHVHAPWQAATAPAGYVAPMVDHAAERDEALARYKSRPDVRQPGSASSR